jgi:hypothetical protein
MMMSHAMFADVVTLYTRDAERASKVASMQVLLAACPDAVLRQTLAAEAGLARYATSLLYVDFVAEMLEMTRRSSPRRQSSRSRT